MFSISIILLIIFLTGLILWFCYYNYQARKHRLGQKPLFTPQYDTQPPKSQYKFVGFNPITDINESKIAFQSQSKTWQNKMAKLGQRFQNSQVKAIVFVHGTFAGTDPFHLIHYISNLFPQMAKIESTFHRIIKEKQNWIIGDLGNFSTNYITLFQEAVGHSIKVFNFDWSSANHHLARFKGTFQLLDTLSEIITINQIKKGDRILLVGHSHAGQLFAILSHLIAKLPHFKDLCRIATEGGLDTNSTHKMINRLKKISLDMVTMGTPPRYTFIQQPNIRLLNIINHRGKKPRGGNITGILTTKDGDYIQQLGITGSDILAPIEKDRYLNLDLDQYFGILADIPTWLNNTKFQKRLPDFGYTILLDYKDDSLIPNFIQTLCGHGTYTRFKTMLFNTKLIADHFYSQK